MTKLLKPIRTYDPDQNPRATQQGRTFPGSNSRGRRIIKKLNNIKKANMYFTQDGFIDSRKTAVLTKMRVKKSNTFSKVNC